MRYAELYARAVALCERYVPALTDRYQAHCALRSVANDPQITVAETAALTEYVGDFAVGLAGRVTTYTWCTACTKMVGYEGGHPHCPDCELPVEFLEDCDRCMDCCAAHCYVCGECNSHTRNINLYCDDCASCTNCCSCDEDDEYEDDEYEDDGEPVDVHTQYGKALVASTRKDRTDFSSTRLAGVEWEFNSVKNDKALANWITRWGGGVHYDGSCGKEAVTSPMSGNYIGKVLTELGAALKTSSASIDERCSVHVHVDAHDYSWFDIYKLIRVYAKLEPLLYLLAGQQRLENRFCIPVGKDYLKALSHPDPKGAIMAVAFKKTGGEEARKFQRKKPGKRTDGRYRGLNLNPWLSTRRNKNPDGTNKATDGTVEFRIHRNCSDPNRVIGWTKLCVRIVDWCASASNKDVDELPKSLLKTLCHVIAPDCSGWVLSRVREWRESTKFNGKFRRRIHVRGGKYEC